MGMNVNIDMCETYVYMNMDMHEQGHGQTYVYMSMDMCGLVLQASL